MISASVSMDMEGRELMIAVFINNNIVLNVCQIGLKFVYFVEIHVNLIIIDFLCAMFNPICHGEQRKSKDIFFYICSGIS